MLVTYSEEDYKYIAIYASNLSYEYALTDALTDEKNSWDNINIYYAKDENGDYKFYDKNRVVINLD